MSSAAGRAGRGFSLIEVLVASAITLVAVTAAVGTLSLAMRFIAERKLRATAEMVAQSHMELLLATASSRPLLSSDCAPVRYSRAVVGDEDMDAVFNATCVIRLIDPADPEVPNFLKLTTTIEAEVDRRRIHSEFVTYLETPP